MSSILARSKGFVMYDLLFGIIICSLFSQSMMYQLITLNQLMTYCKEIQTVLYSLWPLIQQPELIESNSLALSRLNMTTYTLHEFTISGKTISWIAK